MPTRISIKKETVETNYLYLNVARTRWVVRDRHGELWAYSDTWFGAWRLACWAVGYKVPR